METFDWNWLIEIGFTHMEGAPDGYIQCQATPELVLECRPQYIDKNLKEAFWEIKYKNHYRRMEIPWPIVPQTKQEVFSLLERLKANRLETVEE